MKDSVDCSNEQAATLFTCKKQSMVPSAFFVLAGNRFEKIYLHTIVYLQVCKNFVRIFTEERVIETRSGIDDLQKELPEEHFSRINQFCTIALDKIISFDDCYVSLHGGILLTIDDLYKDLLRDKLLILEKVIAKDNKPSAFLIDNTGKLRFRM